MIWEYDHKQWIGKDLEGEDPAGPFQCRILEILELNEGTEENKE
jgi:hypothetical protein